MIPLLILPLLAIVLLSGCGPKPEPLIVNPPKVEKPYIESHIIFPESFEAKEWIKIRVEKEEIIISCKKYRHDPFSNVGKCTEIGKIKRRRIKK